MSKLSEAELAEIEARCNAATEGPFIIEDCGTQNETLWAVKVKETLEWVADFSRKTDADLWIWARTDIPKLIAAIRAGHGELIQAEAFCRGHAESLKATQESNWAVKADTAIYLANQIKEYRSKLPQSSDGEVGVDAKQMMQTVCDQHDAAYARGYAQCREDAAKVAENEWAHVAVGKVSIERQAEYERAKIVTAIRALIPTNATDQGS
jgi:hypothetical protein